MHILASFVPLGMDLLLSCKKLEIKHSLVSMWLRRSLNEWTIGMRPCASKIILPFMRTNIINNVQNVILYVVKKILPAKFNVVRFGI